MATSTYIPLATVTLVASSPQVTFESISQDYSDLVLMIEHKGATSSVHTTLAVQVAQVLKLLLRSLTLKAEQRQ